MHPSHLEIKDVYHMTIRLDCVRHRTATLVGDINAMPFDLILAEVMAVHESIPLRDKDSVIDDYEISTKLRSHLIAEFEQEWKSKESNKKWKTNSYRDTVSAQMTTQIPNSISVTDESTINHKASALKDYLKYRKSTIKQIFKTGRLVKCHELKCRCRLVLPPLNTRSKTPKYLMQIVDSLFYKFVAVNYCLQYADHTYI